MNRSSVQPQSPTNTTGTVSSGNGTYQRAATIMVPNSSLVKHYSVSQTCFKKGIMTKQGAKVKNYKTRYFFLYSNKISYHKMNKKKEPNKTAQGEISLKSLQSCNIYEMKTIEPKAQKEGLQFGFIVEDQERSRNYFLFTETKEETLEWIEAIRQVVSLSNDAVQLFGSSSEPITNTSPVIVETTDQTTSATALHVLTKQPSFDTNLHKSIEIKRLTTNFALLSGSQNSTTGTPTTPRGGLASPRGVGGNTQSSSPVFISSTNSASSLFSTTLNTTALLQKNSHESEMTTNTTTDISSSSNSASFLEFIAAESLNPDNYIQTEDGMSPVLFLYDSPRSGTGGTGNNNSPSIRNSTIPTANGSSGAGNGVNNNSSNQQWNNYQQVMSDEDEFNIALNSAAIFLKDEKQRTPQEQAYVIGMHHFRRQMQEHIRKHGCKPVYNLAVGTVIFCIPEEERTADEEEFYQDLMEQFRGNVEMYKQVVSLDGSCNSSSSGSNMIENLTCAMDKHLLDMSQQLSHHAQDVPLYVQVEIVKAFKLITKKNPSERSEEEELFISRLAETHGILKRLYYKHGLLPNQITLIASILLDNECDLYDNYYMMEERKRSSEENSTTLPVQYFSNSVDYKYYEMKQGRPILEPQE